MRKTCSKCGVEKDLDGFFRNRRSKDGRGVRCADCMRAAAFAYREKNGERVKAKKKQWADAHKDFLKERREERRQKMRSTLDGYLTYAVRQKRSICQMKGIRFELAQRDLKSLFARQNGKCKLTGERLYWGTGRARPDTLSIDRIDPDGPYAMGNVRLVTCLANRAKGRATDEEWAASMRRMIILADGPADVPPDVPSASSETSLTLPPLSETILEMSKALSQIVGERMIVELDGIRIVLEPTQPARIADTELTPPPAAALSRCAADSPSRSDGEEND